MTDQISRCQLLLVVFVLFLAQWGFAGSGVLAKVVMNSEGIDPAIITFLRNLLATPITLLLAKCFEGLSPPRKEDYFIITLLGLFGILLNQVPFLIGVKFTNPVNAAIFQPLCPVIAVFLSAILGIEKIQIRKWTGAAKVLGAIIAATGAILVVVLKESDATSQNPLIGNIALFVSCFSYSTYVVLQKDVLKRYKPITLTAYTYVAGTILLALSFLSGVTQDGFFDLWIVTPISWSVIGYTAIIASALCFVAISWAISKTSATLPTAFIPLQIVGVVILSAIFLDYSFVLSDAIGGSLVVLGLFLVLGGNFFANSKKNLAPGESAADLLPDEIGDGDEIDLLPVPNPRGSQVEHN